MVRSVIAGQNARDRNEVVGRDQQATDEEARKEELRRFVREKWKRIRELESQSSPGVASNEEEDFPHTKQTTSRRLPISKSVEYDPENPFDNDKKRGQPGETRRVLASNTNSDRKGASGSVDAGAASSLRHAKVASSSSTASAREDRPIKNRDVAKSNIDKQSAKSTVRLVRPAERQEQPRPVSPKKQQQQDPVVVPSTSSKMAPRHGAENVPRRRPPLKTASSERIVTKSSSEESALKSIKASSAVPTSKSMTEVVSSVKIDRSEQSGIVPKREDDTPTRRRKRRSEVPHYQPSGVVSLSAGTSNALAELEASLARLKAHSTKASSPSARRKARSPLPSPSQDQGGSRSSNQQLEAAPSPRSRRSLSPAKEMRQMQLELDKSKTAGEGASSSPPKVSFLQRIEQKRAEAVSPLTSSSSSLPEAQSDTSKAVLQEKDAKLGPKKVAKRYSYTPTQRQPEAGSCSIVIGDESIDDMVRQRKASKFLSGIRVFVDVRDQDGEDASSGWTEKLKSVGARVYSKIPSSSSSSSSSNDQSKSSSSQVKLTHIVYKNGRPSTLHYLRSMTSNPTGPAPPIVVGVNWILQSLQQGTKIDERDFLVEVGKQAIFSKVSENFGLQLGLGTEYPLSPATHFNDFKTSSSVDDGASQQSPK